MLELPKTSIKMFDKLVLDQYSSDGNRLLDIDKLINQITSLKTYGIGKYRSNGNNTTSYSMTLGTLIFVEKETQEHLTYIPFSREKEADQVIKQTFSKRFNFIKQKLEKAGLKQNNDPEKPFGKILFAPQRGKLEPNTEQEQFLFRNLHGYFDSNSSFYQQAKNQLSDLLKKNQYTDIIKKPKIGTYIYRGMLLTKDELLKIVPDEELQKHLDGGPNNKVYKTLDDVLMFRPIEQVSSWSKLKRIAHDFAISKVHDKRDNYSVILISQIKKDRQSDFFDLVNWYKDIGGLDNEEEVLALDNVEVFQILYWKESVRSK
jgi:hypothetical protein